MKYNILTVGSKSYFPFIEIFLNSLYETVDLNNINKIYLVLGDMEEFETLIPYSEKLVIVSSKQYDNFSGVHSDGWYDNTKKKTSYLYKLLDEIPEKESLILIDSDVMFLADFCDLIEKDYDIQIAELSEGPHNSKAGVVLSHIACFMVFNNLKKSKLFVQKWIYYMDFLNESKRGKPHETPAMNLTMKDEEIISQIKISSLDDRIICSDLIVYPQTKILHFKSSMSNLNTPSQNFEIRTSSAEYKNDKNKKINYKKYFSIRNYSKWLESTKLKKK